jgi:bifunctional non-homologous end joining protein LigD
MAKTSTVGLESYRSKRDFAVTPEPPARPDTWAARQLFVVQKHIAHRAGLHWDFRLEHNGVLWSWAVPKGPSLDPADKRMAIHVEDHPIEYADFEGSIPSGQYGGGDVELWDRGTWQPVGDPDEGMRKGELKFRLTGQLLNGQFVLVRLRRRDPKQQEAWLLIKERDDFVRAGASAPVLEHQQSVKVRGANVRRRSAKPPAPKAVKGKLPADQAPRLCTPVEDVPDGSDWLNEIKFDGYRLLAWVHGGKVRLVTRNGHDWADRLPAVARALGTLQVQSAVLDGELVALLATGASSFPDLQTALSAGQDHRLFFYVFDLLELNGWDLRSCKLIDRKAVLRTLNDWSGMLRFSEHVAGHGQELYRNARDLHLEGIICKKADSTYRAGRGRDWIKVKCVNQDEFIVLGWTPPEGRRTGIGALHVGYFDRDGRLHYAGGVGTGFSESELKLLRARLDDLAAPSAPELLHAGDPLEPTIRWVRPELVAEVRYPGWSGAGRLRHPVYLGLREDKSPVDVVREIADATAERKSLQPETVATSSIVARRKWRAAIPPIQPSALAKSRDRSIDHPPAALARIVVAKAPRRRGLVIGSVEVTHPDRELWPSVTKQDLAEYWLAVADRALPGLARRPLSIVRCPDGIKGEHFFQKNGHGHLPRQIREGTVSGAPYLAIDDVDGLVAVSQIAAIELHAWGAAEVNPLHPDQIVFDLDPGDGVPFSDVVRAAHDVRDGLKRLGLVSFCRSTGGKGLHVVAPLTPKEDWDTVKRFCRSFAEAMSQREPARFLAHLKLADRGGRILIDWLRNGMGATAVASFSPRARPGATIATPLAWDEVKPGLDPSAFTIRSLPDRLKRLKKDPWQDFSAVDQHLPDIAPARPIGREKATSAGQSAKPAGRGSAIVVARKPR